MRAGASARQFFPQPTEAPSVPREDPQGTGPASGRIGGRVSFIYYRGRRAGDRRSCEFLKVLANNLLEMCDEEADDVRKYWPARIAGVQYLGRSNRRGCEPDFVVESHVAALVESVRKPSAELGARKSESVEPSRRARKRRSKQAAAGSCYGSGAAAAEIQFLGFRIPESPPAGRIVEFFSGPGVRRVFKEFEKCEKSFAGAQYCLYRTELCRELVRRQQMDAEGRILIDEA
jgi:hypothetical protein